MLSPGVRRVWAGLASALAVVLVAVPIASDAATKLAPLVAMAYYDSGSCGHVALSAAIVAHLPSPITHKDAQALERRYRPEPGTTLTVNGRRYALRSATTPDVVSTKPPLIQWLFRPITVTKPVGRRAAGSAATIRLKMTSGPETLRVRVGLTHCSQ